MDFYELLEDPETKVILVRFVTGLPTRLKEMKDACDRGDRESLAEIAHKLKGSSVSFGCNRLSEVAAEIETGAETGSEIELSQKFTQASSLIRELLDRINPK